MPFLLTLALALRVRSKRYPWQVFRDARKYGTALIPFAAFLLVLPLFYSLFYDAVPILGLEEGLPPETKGALLTAWAAEYPLTLVFYHVLSTRMQRDGFYDSPRSSALGGITLDLLKHGVLLALILISLLAADHKPSSEKLQSLKNSWGQIIQSIPLNT